MLRSLDALLDARVFAGNYWQTPYLSHHLYRFNGLGKFQKRSKWSNPTAAFYGIVTTAVLLYLFNQLGWEPSNKVKIRQWMDDVKFGTKNVSDKEHDFIFEIQDQRKTIFYIYQPKDQFRAFVVTELGYDAESAFPQLKAMDKKSLESLIRQLHIDMAQKGVTVDKLLRPLTRLSSNA
jgi:hypothetical protein